MISRELLKGTLKSIVMKLLAEHGRMYGYEITQKVEVLSQGKIKLTYGALYPILHKLEKDGDVVTDTENINNRIRIYYKLTKKGIRTAEEKINELQTFLETIGSIIQTRLAFING